MHFSSQETTRKSGSYILHTTDCFAFWVCLFKLKTLQLFIHLVNNASIQNYTWAFLASPHYVIYMALPNVCKRRQLVDMGRSRAQQCNAMHETSWYTFTFKKKTPSYALFHLNVQNKLAKQILFKYYTTTTVNSLQQKKKLHCGVLRAKTTMWLWGTP